MISDFHFIRPWWLLALVPVALLWVAVRHSQNASRPWRGIIAPHLLPHLLGGHTEQKRFGPLQLLGLGWLVSVMAIAGPTWRREPAPFADDTAALAIVLKISPSMKTEDVQPDRLTRSVEKIHDLLELRKGAKTSLIVYAGTAHVVMPATTDGGIINTFAQALDPKIMPSEGDAAVEALTLADRTLADAGSGSILWITDSIASEQARPLAKWRRSSGTEVRLFPPLMQGAESETVRNAARAVNADAVALAVDDSDVEALARAAKFCAVSGGGKGDRWEETGYWLAPLMGLLLLPFFRRGWMAATGAKA